MSRTVTTVEKYDDHGKRISREGTTVESDTTESPHVGFTQPEERQ